MKLYQDRDWLYQKYIVERLNCPQIAELCKVGKSTIFRQLIRFDIKRRTSSEAHKGQIAWNKDKKFPELSGENSPHWKGGKIKRICKQCGKEFLIYPAWVKKGSGIYCGKDCANKHFSKIFSGEGNPNYGKHWSEDIRHKIGSANRGKKSPFNTRREIKCDFCGKKVIKQKCLIEKSEKHFCDSICFGNWLSKECKNGNIKMGLFKGGEHTQETKDKISLAGKGNKYALGYKHSEETKRKDSIASKKKWQDPEFIKKVLKENKRRPTNPEKVFDELTPEYVRYVGNGKWWRNRHNPDFKVTGQNKVIEIYGDYWHRNDDPKDRIREYEEMGLACLVFWEHEVYEESERILRETLEFIKTEPKQLALV